MEFWGLSLENILSHALFRSKEVAIWKPYSHVHPILVVKKSRPRENVEERIVNFEKHEACYNLG